MSIKLHPVPLCTAGVIGFGWKEAAEVLHGFNELAPTMPDELTVPISAATGPDGGPALFLWPAWSGAPEASADWVARLAGLGQPFVTHVAPMPYPAVLELIAPYIVWGRHYEMRTRNLPAFTDEAIAALVRAGDNRATEFSGFSIHHFHGAATRVPLEQSAFGVRQPHFMVEILAGWEPDADGAAARDWAAAVYDDLAVHALDGGYPSLIGPEQAKQADAAYGPNADRLSALKQRYDPTRNLLGDNTSQHFYALATEERTQARPRRYPSNSANVSSARSQRSWNTGSSDDRPVTTRTFWAKATGYDDSAMKMSMSRSGGIADVNKPSP